MAEQVVVGRELGPDVGRRNVAVHPQREALGHFGHAEREVLLDGIEPVKVVFLQQLVAEQPFGQGVAVIDAVESGRAEVPVDVVGLHRVHNPLEIQHGLAHHQRVGLDVVGH